MLLMIGTYTDRRRQRQMQYLSFKIKPFVSITENLEQPKLYILRGLYVHSYEWISFKLTLPTDPPRFVWILLQTSPHHHCYLVSDTISTNTRTTGTLHRKQMVIAYIGSAHICIYIYAMAIDRT